MLNPRKLVPMKIKPSTVYDSNISNMFIFHVRLTHMILYLQNEFHDYVMSNETADPVVSELVSVVSAICGMLYRMIVQVYCLYLSKHSSTRIFVVVLYNSFCVFIRDHCIMNQSHFKSSFSFIVFIQFICLIINYFSYAYACNFCSASEAQSHLGTTLSI